MSNEITVISNLQITNGSLIYRPGATSFKADMAGDAYGPTPGNLLVTVEGIDVDLTGLSSLGGWCRIQNLDAVVSSVNYLSIGAWDGASFYPLHELLQGEHYQCRLSRDLAEEFGTGTGTTGAGINTLRLKAYDATIPVLVEAFNA